MKDAESHADEDKKRRDEIETRNKADAAVYGAEKFLQEMGDKVPASDKTAVQNAVEGLKKAIADNDVEGMSRAMDLLTQMQHKAAESLYKNAGPQGPGGSEGSAGAGSPGAEGSAGAQGSGSQGAQGDVIDAEVVDDK